MADRPPPAPGVFAGFSEFGEALAAHVIAMNVWNLLAYALDALAIAGQTIIATSLGAGDRSEARHFTRVMTRWSVGAGAVLGLASIAARGWCPIRSKRNESMR